jgi:hypothetical protein
VTRPQAGCGQQGFKPIPLGVSDVGRIKLPVVHGPYHGTPRGPLGTFQAVTMESTMKTVMCYGDSLTWGDNPSDGTRYPFEQR